MPANPLEELPKIAPTTLESPSYSEVVSRYLNPDEVAQRGEGLVNYGEKRLNDFKAYLGATGTEPWYPEVERWGIRAETNPKFVESSPSEQNRMRKEFYEKTLKNLLRPEDYQAPFGQASFARKLRESFTPSLVKSVGYGMFEATKHLGLIPQEAKMAESFGAVNQPGAFLGNLAVTAASVTALGGLKAIQAAGRLAPAVAFGVTEIPAFANAKTPEEKLAATKNLLLNTATGGVMGFGGAITGPLMAGAVAAIGGGETQFHPTENQRLNAFLETFGIMGAFGLVHKGVARASAVMNRGKNYAALRAIVGEAGEQFKDPAIVIPIAGEKRFEARMTDVKYQEAEQLLIKKESLVRNTEARLEGVTDPALRDKGRTILGLADEVTRRVQQDDVHKAAEAYARMENLCDELKHPTRPPTDATKAASMIQEAPTPKESTDIAKQVVTAAPPSRVIRSAGEDPVLETRTEPLKAIPRPDKANKLQSIQNLQSWGFNTAKILPADESVTADQVRQTLGEKIGVRSSKPEGGIRDFGAPFKYGVTPEEAIQAAAEMRRNGYVPFYVQPTHRKPLMQGAIEIRPDGSGNYDVYKAGEFTGRQTAEGAAAQDLQSGSFDRVEQIPDAYIRMVYNYVKDGVLFTRKPTVFEFSYGERAGVLGHKVVLWEYRPGVEDSYWIRPQGPPEEFVEGGGTPPNEVVPITEAPPKKPEPEGGVPATASLVTPDNELKRQIEVALLVKKGARPDRIPLQDLSPEVQAYVKEVRLTKKGEWSFISEAAPPAKIKRKAPIAWNEEKLPLTVKLGKQLDRFISPPTEAEIEDFRNVAGEGLRDLNVSPEQFSLTIDTELGKGASPEGVYRALVRRFPELERDVFNAADIKVLRYFMTQKQSGVAGFDHFKDFIHITDQPPRFVNLEKIAQTEMVGMAKQSELAGGRGVEIKGREAMSSVATPEVATPEVVAPTPEEQAGIINAEYESLMTAIRWRLEERGIPKQSASLTRFSHEVSGRTEWGVASETDLAILENLQQFTSKILTLDPAVDKYLNTEVLSYKKPLVGLTRPTLAKLAGVKVFDLMRQKGVTGIWVKEKPDYIRTEGHDVPISEIESYPDRGDVVNGETVVIVNGSSAYNITQGADGKLAVRIKKALTDFKRLTGKRLGGGVYRTTVKNLKDALYAANGFTVEMLSTDGRLYVRNPETKEITETTPKEVEAQIRVAPNVAELVPVPEMDFTPIPESFNARNAETPMSDPPIAPAVINDLRNPTISFFEPPPAEPPTPLPIVSPPGAPTRVGWLRQLYNKLQWATRKASVIKDVFARLETQLGLPFAEAYRKIENASGPLADWTVKLYPRLDRLEQSLRDNPIDMELLTYLAIPDRGQAAQYMKDMNWGAKEFNLAREVDSLADEVFEVNKQRFLSEDIPDFVASGKASHDLRSWMDQGFEPQLNSVYKLINNGAFTRMRLRVTPYIKQMSEMTKGVNDLSIPEDMKKNAIAFTESYLHGKQFALNADKAVASAMLERINEKLGLGLTGTVPSQIISHILTLTRGSTMAFRPGTALRNLLFQTPMTLGLWVGMKPLGEGAARMFKPEGIALAGELRLLTGETVPMQEYELRAGATQGSLASRMEYWTRKTINLGMVPFSKGEYVTKSWAANTGYILAERYGLKFMAGEINLPTLLRKTGAIYMEKAYQQHFLRPLADAMVETDSVKATALFEQAKLEHARNLMEDTHWIYRTGNSPLMFRSKIGKLFGQYGTWPLSYINWASKSISTGDPVATAQFLARYIAVTGALYVVGREVLGVDPGYWAGTGPFLFGGGPTTSVAADLSMILSQGYRGQVGKQFLKHDILVFVPGAGAVRDVIRTTKEAEAAEAFKRLLSFPTWPRKNQ